jgi:hypothetical protein
MKTVNQAWKERGVDDDRPPPDEYINGCRDAIEAYEAEKQVPLHPVVLFDWLAARYRAAGGKEGITDLSAFCEEVMRWTETKHGITGAKT